MELILVGHNIKHGHAVSVQYTDTEIRELPAPLVPDEPIRYYQDRRFADRVISRFNRRMQRHQCITSDL
jgi:hypothetical protein